jgi:rhodanese-related sulfurtransferase
MKQKKGFYMKRRIMLLLLSAIAIFMITGCSVENNETENNKEDVTPSVIKIDAEEAKKMMESSEDIIILDVRTEDEYNSGHIEDSILIPDNEISDKAEEVLSDKTATILVYCRSGRRSASASQVLNDLGYTSIYDFGGIIDWPYAVE